MQEKFTLQDSLKNELLDKKPDHLTRSRYWVELIKKGSALTDILEEEKMRMQKVALLSKKHNEEIAELLGKRESGDWWDFDNVLEVLKRQQKELDDLVANVLDEVI
jgi:hypothetical protein